jgi:hypothetical protein
VPGTVGVAVSVTWSSAPKVPVQTWAAQPCGQGGNDRPDASTLPSPSIPTSSSSGVKIAASHSSSSTGVNVQGSVPGHSDRLQWRNSDVLVGSGTATTLTLAPLDTGAGHGF